MNIILAYIGVVLMVALSGSGSAYGTSIAANATVGAMKKRMNSFGQSMILSALPATQGLYGFAAFFLMLNKLKVMETLSINASLAVLAVGVALGIVGFYSAIKQASLVANGINEMANGNDVFGKTLILGVFPELYAILAFAAAFLALPA